MKSNYRHLQAAGGRPRGFTQAESGWRPAGGSQRPRGRVQGGSCYPLEHYDYWRKELPGHELPMGVFGGSPSTERILEESTCIGNRFAVGSTAEVFVTQPRMPCYKLAIRFQAEDMVKRFLASRAEQGFYLAVRREGEAGAGDEDQGDCAGPGGRTGVGNHAPSTRKRDTAPMRRRPSGAPCGWRHCPRCGKNTFESGSGR